jgi:hypothetical protein
MTELRIPLLRSVKRRLAAAAVDEGTSAGRLAARIIKDGLDARERSPASK